MIITCVCCTYKRPKQVGHLIYMFQRQIHQSKRLIILDDGGSFVNPHEDHDDWWLTTDPTGANLDDRLECPRCEPSNRRCGRPLLEFIIDAYGNHHPCCYDWQGKASLGNVFVDGFAAIVERWRNFQGLLCGSEMQPGAPEYCRSCNSHFRYEG